MAKEYLVTYVEDSTISGPKVGEIFFFKNEAIEFATRLRAKRDRRWQGLFSEIEVFEAHRGTFDPKMKHPWLESLKGKLIFKALPHPTQIT